MKNVAFHNLGCKVNSYETEVMQQILQENGYNIVPFDSKADIYIVNTCTVTNIADRKSRQMLHRARQLNPEAVVVAAGCYVQTGLEALERDDGVDLVVGNNRKKDIAQILERFFRERAEKACAGMTDRDKTLGGSAVIDINSTRDYEETRLKRTMEHTRAYIKIQDGCNQFCSYCAIPYARGRARSRRPEDVLTEIRGLADAGFREVLLTGIHLSSYGFDFADKADVRGGGPLVRLAEQIQEIEGISRIRMGSLEPRIITEETAARLAAIPKLCPHFHLSLQSGCDSTLRRMNRKYTAGEYYESVEYLRRAFDRPAVTTDVIVGFPGETEEEFAQTRAFLEKVRFYEMHIFKYSRREGTKAAAMPEQVPEQVKARRSDELLALEKRQSREFREAYIGNEAEVLLEEEAEIGGRSYMLGYTKDYVKVAVRSDGKAGTPGVSGPNTMARVTIKGFLTDEVLM